MRPNAMTFRLVSIVQLTHTNSCGFGTGRDLSNILLIRLKVAVFAPMARASDVTATSVKTGDLSNCRILFDVVENDAHLRLLIIRR